MATLEWDILHVVNPLVIFGSGIKLQILGHKRQISVEHLDKEQSVSQLENRDTLVLVTMDHYSITIFGNGTKLLIHGYKEQAFLATSERLPVDLGQVPKVTLGLACLLLGQH